MQPCRCRQAVDRDRVGNALASEPAQLQRPPPTPTHQPQAMALRFFEHCRQRGISLPPGAPNFQLSYSTTIPRQRGLSGSSAIAAAALNCLLRHYSLEAAIPVADRPQLVLAAEAELGIAAGLQDRVVQVGAAGRCTGCWQGRGRDCRAGGSCPARSAGRPAGQQGSIATRHPFTHAPHPHPTHPAFLKQIYGGLVHMDFGAETMQLTGRGRYTSLDPTLLPPLWLIYRQALAMARGGGCKAVLNGCPAACLWLTSVQRLGDSPCRPACDLPTTRHCWLLHCCLNCRLQQGSATWQGQRQRARQRQAAVAAGGCSHTVSAARGPGPGVRAWGRDSGRSLVVLKAAVHALLGRLTQLSPPSGPTPRRLPQPSQRNHGQDRNAGTGGPHGAGAAQLARAGCTHAAQLLPAPPAVRRCGGGC